MKTRQSARHAETIANKRKPLSQEDIVPSNNLKKQKRIPTVTKTSSTGNKKKPVKKKSSDKGWSKSYQRTKNRGGKKTVIHSSLFKMRTDNQFIQNPVTVDNTTLAVVDEEKKRRFIVMVDSYLFVTYALDLKEANQRMLSVVKEFTESNKQKGQQPTPTKIVTNFTITGYSKAGSPIACKSSTPNHTEFKRLHTGLKSSITILTDDPSLWQANDAGDRKALDDAETLKQFLESPVYQATVENEQAVKEIEFEITPEQQKKVKDEIEENNGGRKKGQAQIMAIDYKHVKDATATKTLSASGIFAELTSEIKGEWSDLGAHSLTGNDSRKPENLIATPAAPNTVMLISPENLLHMLKNIYDKIKVNVLATTIETVKIKTHIGDQILYKIQTDHFKLEFLIDGLNTKKPHIMIKIADDIAYKVFIDMIREKHNQVSVAKKQLFPDSNKKTTSNDMPMFFHRKPAKRKLDDSPVKDPKNDRKI